MVDFQSRDSESGYGDSQNGEVEDESDEEEKEEEEEEEEMRPSDETENMDRVTQDSPLDGNDSLEEAATGTGDSSGDAKSLESNETTTESTVEGDPLSTAAGDPGGGTGASGHNVEDVSETEKPRESGPELSAKEVAGEMATAKEPTEEATTKSGPGPGSKATSATISRGAETMSYALVTVSGTTDIERDDSGRAIADAIAADTGTLAIRELIQPSYDGVQTTIDGLVGRRDVDIVITVGGTGVSADDVTVDACRPLFERELPGFGELLRELVREDLGSRVIGTRTTAGIVDRTPVFCLPGLPMAARQGVEEIIAPEAAALVEQARQ